MTAYHGAVASISFQYDAVAAAVPLVRRRLRVFAAENGAARGQLGGIALAVTEAAANVVKHAYPDAAGSILVDADVDEGDLEVVIRDDGAGFTTEPAPGLGLGLALMSTHSAALEVRDHPCGGVEVWMRFPIAQ